MHHIETTVLAQLSCHLGDLGCVVEVGGEAASSLRDKNKAIFPLSKMVPVIHGFYVNKPHISISKTIILYSKF